MGFESFLKTAATAAATEAARMAADELHRQALGELGVGGRVTFDGWLPAAFPGARQVGRGVYALTQPAGGRAWQLTAYEVAGTCVFTLDTGLREAPRDVEPALMAALLGRNARAVYPKWCLAPDGRNVALTCVAAVPVGSAADLAREVVGLVAREAAEVADLLD